MSSLLALNSCVEVLVNGQWHPGKVSERATVGTVKVVFDDKNQLPIKIPSMKVADHLRLKVLPEGKVSTPLQKSDQSNMTSKRSAFVSTDKKKAKAEEGPSSAFVQKKLKPKSTTRTFVPTKLILEDGIGEPEVLGVYTSEDAAIHCCQLAARKEVDMAAENENDPEFFNEMFNEGVPYEYDDGNGTTTIISYSGPHKIVADSFPVPAKKKARCASGGSTALRN
jgi:hypothetical protein